MNKLIVPSLIAALAVFIWSFISWTVLDWHNIDISNFPDETDAGMEEWIKKYETGLLATCYFYNAAWIIRRIYRTV